MSVETVSDIDSNYWVKESSSKSCRSCCMSHCKLTDHKKSSASKGCKIWSEYENSAQMEKEFRFDIVDPEFDCWWPRQLSFGPCLQDLRWASTCVTRNSSIPHKNFKVRPFISGFYVNKLFGREENFCFMSGRD